ncbi:MAG: hypothetical protein WKF76_00580 [Nocardioidaceae bacterium]
MRHEYLNQFTALLSGADAGHYGLPPEVTAARGVLARADEAATAYTRPNIERSRAAFAAEIILTCTGDDWPDPARMVAVEDSSRAYDEWQVAVHQGQLIAEQSLYEVLSADPDRLIVDYLQPAHAEAVKTAKANAALAPLADDPTVLGALTAGQRTKADALAKAAAQYAAVRAAWAGLTRTGQQTRNDNEGIFGELRDLPDVWPTYRQRGTDQPWPTTPSHGCAGPPSTQPRGCPPSSSRRHGGLKCSVHSSSRPSGTSSHSGDSQPSVEVDCERRR